MVRGFVVLLVCQLVGEAVVCATGLLVPGPVLGMALLIGGFAVTSRLTPKSGEQLLGATFAAGDGLLNNLGLLFVPAGVGVIQYGGLLARYGIAIGLAVLVSTLVTLVATVATFLAVKRLLRTADVGEP